MNTDESAKKTDEDWWHAFQKTDLSNAAPWSEHYRTGKHRAIWDHSFASPELVAYIMAAGLAADTRVLDLGCGSGQDAVFLAKQGFDVHGLDFSVEALGLAEKRALKCGVAVSWHHCSATDTPFDANHFDLVTDRGCFHHIGGLRRSKYADEIARILKPGGALLLRGCRSEMPPFFPVNRKTVVDTFDPQLFEIGDDHPFWLVVDGGGIEATMVRIIKK